MCTVGDTVLLGRGKYPIKPCSELPRRGTIMGICDTEDTILCPKGLDALSSLFDITDTEVSNATIINKMLHFMSSLQFYTYNILLFVLFLSIFLVTDFVEKYFY